MCGKRCCPKGTFCCHEGKRLCCSNKVACVHPGEQDAYCCPLDAPNAGRVAKPGADGPGGRDPDGCCGDDRWVERFRFCCPKGELAIKRPTFGVDLSGRSNCCPAAKLCGPAGPNQRCCATFATDPNKDQICCDGKCVFSRFDPSHCGGCNKRCADDQLCEDGVCVPA